MTDTTNDAFNGNAQVIDFGPALAARRARKEMPTDAKRLSYRIELKSWPLDDLRWLADQMEGMYAFQIASQLRNDCDEAERAP